MLETTPTVEKTSDLNTEADHNQGFGDFSWTDDPFGDMKELQYIPEEVAIYPEFVGNHPLPDTTLVYSVLAKGEWKNGNLLRYLRAKLGERTSRGESQEIEILVNSGEALLTLFPEREDRKLDVNGELQYPQQVNDQNMIDAREVIEESKMSADFLRRVVEIQSYTRELLSAPYNGTIRQRIETTINAEQNTEQRNVLELAAAHANTISVCLVDASEAFLRFTNHYGSGLVGMAGLRTLGADIVATRFSDRPGTVMSLYDIDTLPEHNHAAQDLQEIYHAYPDLPYLFTGMSVLPPGYSTRLMADAPAENVQRTASYNRRSFRGSPQISFRLSTLETLNKISSFGESGFYGQEDIDTAKRLIYLFGDLSADLESTVFPPTSLTADRITGHFDSGDREKDYQAGKVQDLDENIAKLLSQREYMLGLINALPPDRRNEALAFLDQARVHYRDRERLQQRFLRLFIRSFVQAANRGYLRVDESDNLDIDEDSIAHLFTGESLLLFVHANTELVREVLGSHQDMEVVSRLLNRNQGNTDINNLSPFQAAICEYIGDVDTLDNTMATRSASSNWPRFSLMHAAVAESLALGITAHRYLHREEMLAPLDKWTWPDNPQEQAAKLHLSNREERLSDLREHVAGIS